ncbi:MAG: radical SAM protein [bacterium]
MNIRKILEIQPHLMDKITHIQKEPCYSFPTLSCKIKLTFRCNLRCTFCRIWQKPRVLGTKSDQLSTGRIKEIIAELKRMGLLKIHFSGGEVLLRKDYQELIEFSNDEGLQVNMTTNGTLLDKTMARFLVNARIHTITISIDSPFSEVHDAMRGSKGAWKASWKGLDYLLKYKKKKHPLIAINTLITRDTISSLDQLHAMIKEKHIDAWHLLPVNTEKKKLRPSPLQWSTLADRWCEWRDKLSRLPVDWSSPQSVGRVLAGKYAGTFYKEKICYAPWFNLFIDADGLTYPCCMGRQGIPSYGNLITQSLGEVLGSQVRDEVCCSMGSGHIFGICEYCDDFLEENEIFHHLSKKEEI